MSTKTVKYLVVDRSDSYATMISKHNTEESMLQILQYKSDEDIDSIDIYEVVKKLKVVKHLTFTVEDKE